MESTGNSDIIFVYFVGTFAMILLATFIFFFFITYQKKLLKKELELNKIRTQQQEILLKNIVLAQEKERKRIAQDLHDEVGAMLSLVKLNVGRIEKKADTDLSKNLAIDTKNHLDNVIHIVRQISRALLPPSLEKLGLVSATAELVSWVNKTGQIMIDFWHNNNSYRFDRKKELALFRIIQELLNNAIKHSGANTIKINMRFVPNRLTVSFSDNGKGFNVEEKLNSGLGLTNLESRTKILGGKYKIKSVEGKGTFSLIDIYLDNEYE